MSKTIDLITPFGPQLGRVDLDSNIVSYLNSHLDDTLADYSHKLVGKVSQELLFSKEITEFMLEELKPYLVTYHNNSVLEKGRDLEITVHGGWYVRQYANEYNPLHIHTHCTISVVGYLSLPQDIEDEWENEYKSRLPTNGFLEFAYGSAAMPYCLGSKRVRPKVGELYIFPSGLWHVVYPFFSPGERRSFSMNFSIFSKNT